MRQMFALLASALLQAQLSSAVLMSAQVYQSSDCSGDEEYISTDVSTKYCFAVGGNSFDNTYLDFDSSECGTYDVTTWSGSNCEGSSAVYGLGGSGCESVPFAGIQLSCHL